MLDKLEQVKCGKPVTGRTVINGAAPHVFVIFGVAS